MKKIYTFLTFLIIVIFLVGCQTQQRLPSPPGSIQVPIGQAGAALPTWAVDAGNVVTVDPISVEVIGAEEKTITVDANDDYVWSTFYVLTNDQQWTAQTFDCTPVEGSGWCAGNVDRALDVGITDFFRQTNYILVYSCGWDQAQESFDCSGNKWKVQTYEIVEGSALSAGPPASGSSPTTGTTTSAISSGIPVEDGNAATTGP